MVEDAVSGRKSVNEVVDALFEDMGRGSRILVTDENLTGLDVELGKLNYTVQSVERGLTDDQIKRQMAGKILVTSNGQDFVDGVEAFYYGLVWVQHSSDYKALAKKIEQALMTTGFRNNLTQVIKV